MSTFNNKLMTFSYKQIRIAFFHSNNTNNLCTSRCDAPGRGF